ncbi:MAG TPA: ATP-binding protein, partial [Tichowtungia sp.]|nr:ATP-binding protein [Tichowtungia sp.]
IWIHWSIRAVRSETGAVTGLLCIGTDITRRKHAEIRAAWHLKRSRHLADQLVQTEERERSRIAQYLHDQVVQVLSLANIRMGGLLHELNRSDRTNEADHLAGVRHLVEDAIGECRSMMNELVPTLLYEVGLGAALKHLTEQEYLTSDTSIRVDDRLGKAPLPRRVSGLLFQSVRELLMNALKYAGPCEIEVRVSSDGRRATVAVSDTGRGFDPDSLERLAETETGGFGLFNIRERLEAVGGVLRIDSAPGRGTHASITVPIPS